MERYFVIQSVDGQLPEGLKELAKHLYGKKKGEPVKLDLVIPVRRGNTIAGFRKATATLTVR